MRFGAREARCRIVLCRRHVWHETAKNFQLDLFDPNDGHYEYTAVVTNKSIDGPALWAFMCGRGVHEKVYGELKSGFAFGSVPSMRYAANGAWQCLSVLAFNLSRSFQLATTARRRRSPVNGARSSSSRRFTPCAPSVCSAPGSSCIPTAARSSMSAAPRPSRSASTGSIASWRA